MSGKASNPNKFEHTLGQVEEIVEQIERGEIPLQEVVGKFKIASQKIRDCRAMLSEIEQQIKIIDGGEEQADSRD